MKRKTLNLYAPSTRSSQKVVFVVVVIVAVVVAVVVAAPTASESNELSNIKRINH